MYIVCLQKSAIPDVAHPPPPLTQHTHTQATLIPVFLHLKDKEKGVDVNSIIYTIPDDDYNGVQDFKAFVGPNGNPIFVDRGELTKANGYYSDKVGMLYESAFSTPKSLVLNITNPGVQTHNNVHNHAEKIQTAYEKVGCIVFVAKEIVYYPPKNTGRDTERFDKRHTISQVIQHADDEDGLDMPLVVIGYSQMIRGDSFRSDYRVPTHMCCALGTCMSIDKMVQAMGRATYGDSKLEQNGFTHVTVLTFANDYDTAKAYPVWLQEMNDKIKGGMSIGDALSSSATYTDQANVTFGQNRTIGQKRDKLVLEVGFEQPNPDELRDGAKYTQTQILQDPLLKSVYEVAKENYAEDLNSFRAELQEDIEVGGTAEEYLSKIRSRSPDLPCDIKVVRAALQKLAAKGTLKSSSVFGPVQRGNARYFIPDTDVL